MASVLDKIRAAHDARQMVRVHVREYGIDMYFPTLTVADRARVRRGVNPKNEDELLVNALMHMAHDADGKKLFDDTPQVRAELHRMGFDVLQDIVTRAGGGASADLRDEVSRLDADGARAALAGLLADAPGLADAVAAAKDDVVLAAVTEVLLDLGAAHEANATAKNG
jgi:hypothetical protein